MAKTQLGMVFLTIIIILKIAAFIHDPHTRPLKADKYHIDAKAAEGILSFVIFILAVINISSRSYNKSSDYEKCDDADADIVGGGILIAAWIQIGILSLIAFTGLFHFGRTPIKEVGAGLLLTHVSLAIALVVSLGGNNLSVQDAILGAMVLDGQNAALSLQLLTKEILASRWQTAMVVGGQSLGLVIEGIVVDAFHRNSLVPKGCRCLRVFWWVWFGNCDTPEPNDIYPFWCYFALRCGLFLEGLWITATQSRSYHIAEKKEREDPCSRCEGCEEWYHPGTRPAPAQQHPQQGDGEQPAQEVANWLHRRQQSAEDANQCHEPKKPSTISAIVVHRALFAILSMISTLYTMATYSMKASANMDAVGQVAAMVIGAGTTLRVLWVAYHSCYPLLETPDAEDADLLER
ncbi:unnamed protein product [Clonostachys byssicola]|uniref:Uncharacterized protein n=1 Tax=Clonostachys byssicola TaxID=160290 RepID=A0A9N9U8M0_9HYPO|nr:unnamed protein product [Clonostachys byssicola]